VNVLSLFGGMECGRITLDLMGVTPTKYYSSEIDKFAIKEVSENYPDVIHMGNIEDWKSWDINWWDIDLVIGGSPCQGFSFAGKQLAFNDPRSRLFFIFVEILECVKTMRKVVSGSGVYFMLENVRMKKEHLEVITKYLGVEPVFINSSLVSAQNRRRYYWCNWNVSQPEDTELFLSDIVELNPTEPTFMSDKFMIRNRRILRHDLNGKAKTLSAMEYVKNGRQGDYVIQVNPSKESSGKQPYSQNRVYHYEGKSPALTASFAGRTNITTDEFSCRKLTVIECCRLQGVPDDYFKVSSNNQAYKMLGNGWQVDTIKHILQSCEVI